MHHVCPSSNCPLHEHVLSFPKVRWLVILLLAGSFVAHLNMPLPCGLLEGKAASLLPPGDDNVVGVHLCLNSFFFLDCAALVITTVAVMKIC